MSTGGAFAVYVFWLIVCVCWLVIFGHAPVIGSKFFAALFWLAFGFCLFGAIVTGWELIEQWRTRITVLKTKGDRL